MTDNRLILLKEAIACYCDQTYPNRELVIVTNGSTRYQDAIADHLLYLGRNDIRLVQMDEKDASLGRLRNISLDQASGDLMCQWDDDDLYHPERIRLQYEAMIQSDAVACYLTDHLQFFVHEQALYWIDWAYYSHKEDEKCMVPGTVLAYRDSRFFYPETGQDSRIGEDNAIRSSLFKHGPVATLPGKGYLYVYRYHGRNYLPGKHHEGMRAWGCLELDCLREREAVLRSALPAYPLPMPYKVKSRNGSQLFTIN